jgi:hypothetical protein
VGLGGFGFPAVILLAMFGVPAVVFVIVVIGVALSAVRRAKRLGYASTGAYLRAAPHSDPEKRDAADLALKGVVLCLLGFLFPPFVLTGLVPLFYGGRKLVYASMGLGLVDDGDRPAA